MKKALSLILAAVLCFGIFTVAFAGESSEAKLKFNQSGKFKIAHITDTHCHSPIENYTKQFIIELLDSEKPDLVVLGGDIDTEPEEEKKAKVIEELCNIFIDRQTYFTLTLGNHDNEGKIKEEFLAYFQQYGGDYFLGCDAVPALTGCGTHDLEVKSSDGTKTAFALFMFDSGSTVYNEKGERLGYDSVHTDQIEWYKARVKALKDENNGKVVPSMAFQHTIVQEIDDKVFYNVKKSAGKLGEDFNNRYYLFTPIPKIHNIKSGVILEKPCPGYYNFGELEAMKESKDVIAVFSGHDHSNTFTVNIDGIDIVNTGGCKSQSWFRLFTSGARIITIDENNPAGYESHMVSFAELGNRENSKIFEKGEIGKAEIIISTIIGKIISAAMFVFYLINK